MARAKINPGSKRARNKGQKKPKPGQPLTAAHYKMKKAGPKVRNFAGQVIGHLSGPGIPGTPYRATVEYTPETLKFLAALAKGEDAPVKSGKPKAKKKKVQKAA